MADLRVHQSDTATERPLAVSRDGASPQRGGEQQTSERHHEPTGAEELAVALAESDRGETLMARFEVDEHGEPLIRIVDRARDETVALITPEELKALAEDTGLPPGLLLQAAS